MIVSLESGRLGTSKLQLQSDHWPGKRLPLRITTSSWSQQAHPTLLFSPASCSKARNSCVSWTAGSYGHWGMLGAVGVTALPFCPHPKSGQQDAGSHLTGSQVRAAEGRENQLAERGRTANCGCRCWSRPSTAVAEEPARAVEQGGSSSLCDLAHGCGQLSKHPSLVPVSELGLKQASGRFKVR